MAQNAADVRAEIGIIGNDCTGHAHEDRASGRGGRQRECDGKRDRGAGGDVGDAFHRSGPDGFGAPIVPAPTAPRDDLRRMM